MCSSCVNGLNLLTVESNRLVLPLRSGVGRSRSRLGPVVGLEGGFWRAARGAADAANLAVEGDGSDGDFG